MSQQTLNFEAETLEEARAQAELKVPEGLCLLCDKVISDGLPKTARGVADTVRAAYSKAKREVPARGRILTKKELIAASQRVITVEAPDEQAARAQVEAEAGDSAVIKSLHLVTPGKRAFLVFAKSPNVYEARVFQNVVVELTYQAPARIAATYGERPGHGLALAVMAYAEGPFGLLTFRGTAPDGQSVDLKELAEGAILFVPRDTLRHLRDSPLWSRVSNPSVADDDELGVRKAQAANPGVLGAILESAGDVLVADPLMPGEFRLAVVDTFRDALLRVKAIHYLRT